VDTLKFAGRFDVYVGGSPVGGQIATESGGQNGLPELL